MNRDEYELFCFADRVFFEPPERLADEADRFPDALRPAPDGWTAASTGLWHVLQPADTELPEQGWKIHVSAAFASTGSVIERVARFCVDREVAFKFLRSPAAVRIATSKSAPRATSGKVVTVYPRDDARFTRLARDLADELAGVAGPYILSDLRVGAGPVFVRFGGFRSLVCTGPDGSAVPAVRHPDGHLVPDERLPVFTMPDWVDPPALVADELAARDAVAGDLPYEVTGAIAFSNGGGVYRGRDPRTGADVVLREARPLAGVDNDGRDAVSRLRTERAILDRLAGLPCVPRVVDYVTVWEHEFLVEEYVEGRNLLSEMLARHPLSYPDLTDERRREFARWLDDVVGRVADAVAAVHDRGVVWGDAHPGNVLVRPDGSVVLIDFEAAGLIGEGHKPGLVAAGFTAPAGTSGVDGDDHAVDRMVLMGIMPHAPALSALRPERAAALLDQAAASLPLSAALRRRLTGGRPGDGIFDGPVPGWPVLRTELAAGILDTATPDRPDRLFPGDPELYASGGIDLANGAAGVLYALHTAGLPIDTDHRDWLARTALARAARRPQGGLYKGPLGAALALRSLGAVDEAERIVRDVEDHLPAHTGFGTGLAGLALVLLDDGAHDRDRERRALRLADLIAGTLAGTANGPAEGGLYDGASGPAELFIRCYERTGLDRYLDAARRALRLDLDRCRRHDNGALYLLRAAKNQANLTTGSGGIALVVDHYLRHRDDADLRAAREDMLFGMAAEQVVECGLFLGRAGLIAILQRCRPDDRAVIDDHIAGLRQHAVTHQGRLMFPGRLSRRLSTDLATGSAGVLLALHAAATGTDPGLPGLAEPTRSPAPALATV